MANAFFYGPYYRQSDRTTDNTVAQARILAYLDDGAGAPYTGAVVAGDVKTSRNSGAEANIGTLPTHLAGGVWSFILSAAELADASYAYIRVSKAGIAATVILVETRLAVGQMRVDCSTGTNNLTAVTFSGFGTGGGLTIGAGATGRAITIAGGASGGATTEGVHIASGSGAPAVRLVAGNAVGNSSALKLEGVGTGHGLETVGGATGRGAAFTGGSTSGAGATFTGTAGNSPAIDVVGQGSAAGLNITGGATGDGIKTIGGATSGHGIHATATASGDGFHGVGAGGGSAANFGGGGASLSWDDLEGTEPSGPPPSNASFRQIMQYLKRTELNYATEGAGTRRVYKDDSSTVLYSQVITVDPTTRTRGGAQ